MAESETTSTATESPQLVAAKEAFREFLQFNPLSSIEEVERPAGIRRLVIQKPWGDETVSLSIPDAIAPFASELNNLILPSRYSAVWHRDTKDFEVLWSTYKLPKIMDEVAIRHFCFRFRGNEYKCEFGRSSDQVLLLGKAFRAVTQSNTGHRNLPSFSNFVTTPEARERMGDPLSFWIRGVEWNEDDVLNLVTHLNFYLIYFDVASPTILLHSPPPSTVTKRRTRYTAGEFPKNISTREIDPNVLFLWDAASSGAAAQRFLYYYRIIEYSAVAYLDSTARSALRMALALPNALDDLGAVTESVVAAVQRMNMNEFSRYETMLEEVVAPKLLWRELSLNLTAFTSDTQFDGGFKVSALLTANSNESEFTSRNVLAFAKVIRDMRNALSHGRDQKTGTTITPSIHNFAKLQPWIGPIALAASQIIVYKGVL